MGKKSKKAKKQKYNVAEPYGSRIGLTVRLCASYYLALGAFVFLVSYYKIPLIPYDPEGRWNVWYFLLLGMYYIVPVCMAVLSGILFRPFWSNFRNLMLTVIVIHGLYSFSVFLVRQDYLQDYRKYMHRVSVSEIEIIKFYHKSVDNDHDGHVEHILFSMIFDVSGLEAGKYKLQANLSQHLESIGFENVGRVAFEVAEIQKNPAVINFKIAPDGLMSLASGGSFSVDVVLKMFRSVDGLAQKVVEMSRWAPFRYQTSWDGGDSKIYPDVITLLELPSVDTFELQAPIDPDTPVQFLEFLGDKGEDSDWDGALDYIVVQMVVDSEYEGDVFLEALIRGAPESLFSQETLQKGRQTIEYAVRTEFLLEFGLNGPYELTEFRIYNEDSRCVQETCLPHDKESFSIDLDNYVTNEYHLDDFRPSKKER